MCVTQGCLFRKRMHTKVTILLVESDSYDICHFSSGRESGMTSLKRGSKPVLILVRALSQGKKEIYECAEFEQELKNT